MRHLTEKDRYYIEIERKRKTSVKDIAAALGFSRVAIYAEIKRGTVTQIDRYLKPYQVYLSDAGQRVHDDAMAGTGRPCKLVFDDEYIINLRELIQKKKYSPYAAMQVIGKNKVCQRTIYNYAYDKKYGLSVQDLPYAKPKKKKKVQKGKKIYTDKKKSIEDRPKEASNRQYFGHWEMDTVYSGKKKSTVALLVLTERKTRNENIIVVPDRRAETTVRAINALERKLGAEKFGIIYKSITVDNGSEFALADQLEQSCITGDKRTKVYYCHPYSSWERGSNENVNGMIRRRHPKGTDFSKVTAEEIAATENWINSYPRKIFGYKSAGTMFRECLRELGLTA